MARAALALALAGAVVASTAQAAPSVKHSGSIVGEDPAAHTITLEEMGPWAGPGKGLVRRTIRLTPETTIELVSRATGAAAGGWPDGFTESPLAASALRPGDYATVTTADRGGRLTAVSIEVVRPGSAGGSRRPSNPRATLR